MNKVLQDLKLNPDNSKLSALYKNIKKNIPPAKINTREPGYIFQADLLFMPDDGGYKYILTVIDTNNNATDAEPLKEKTTNAIINGLRAIFKRKPLYTPRFSLETDPGGEFNNKKLIKFLNDKNIFLRVGASGRSDQQAKVEYMQGIIAQILFKFMTNTELQTNEQSNEWVDELSDVIKSINKHLTVNKQDQVENNVLFSSKENIIPIGTKVRVALDKPVNVVDGKRLIGKFRKTDIRWQIKPETIEDISLRANEPVLYKISSKNHNYFTRNQLQIVKEDEALPAPKKYIIEKIIKPVMVKGLKNFEVKWKGYAEHTIEPRKQLIKDIPDMVKEFEKNYKK